MIKIIIVLLSFISTLAQADNVKMAERFLLLSPSAAYSEDTQNKHLAAARLSEPMFSSDPNIRHGRGYNHYINMVELADKGDPYAAYAVAQYMLSNQEKFNFAYLKSLLYLKKAKDAGIADAKFTLAMAYINRSNGIAKLLNQDLAGAKNQKDVAVFERLVTKDAEQLKRMGLEFILELAAQGHRQGFVFACNFYVTGEYLPKSSWNAAMCYDNAIRIHQSASARRILVQLYLQDPAFNNKDFEIKAIGLAQEAVKAGDVRAMALLGLRLIYPIHLDFCDPEAGAALIHSAAIQGDELALQYQRQYFDGSNRLLIKPTKPIKAGFIF